MPRFSLRTLIVVMLLGGPALGIILAAIFRSASIDPFFAVLGGGAIAATAIALTGALLGKVGASIKANSGPTPLLWRTAFIVIAVSLVLSLICCGILLPAIQ